MAEELGESPEEYAYQRDRLRTAREAGWSQSARIDFSNPHISEVVDKTRKRMVTLSADDVIEDEIEKTDTVLAGLAYQYATGGSGHVSISVSDRIAEQAIEDMLSAVDVGDTTTVIEGRSLLEELVADQL